MLRSWNEGPVLSFLQCNGNKQQNFACELIKLNSSFRFADVVQVELGGGGDNPVPGAHTRHGGAGQSSERSVDLLLFFDQFSVLK